MHISSAKIYGGGERHVADLCRGLQSRGHEVFAALRPTNEWQKRLSFLQPENILHVSIRNSFGVLSALKIADFVKEHEIEIVHAHVARDYIPASIACLAAKKANFFLTRHVLFPLKPFNKFALKNLTRAIGVSDAVGAQLRSIFPKEIVSVIPNGINVSNFDSDESKRLDEEFRSLHNIPFDAILVGTLGELKELKGQRDFVLAAAEIVKEIPDCRFVIAGKDNSIDKSFRRELKRLVKVFELEDRFLWLDWLEDAAPFYAAADVFVSPSHSESFGLAMLEAMIHGKAIAATATEGAKELLGRDDVLVPIKDPVALAKKIVEMIRDKELRSKIGTEFRSRAAERFDLKRMVEETEHLYENVLGSNK
ncbi:MAG: glycosyltransferase family 4 protein [Blastocatellia bacterium]